MNKPGFSLKDALLVITLMAVGANLFPFLEQVLSLMETGQFRPLAKWVRWHHYLAGAILGLQSYLLIQLTLRTKPMDP